MGDQQLVTQNFMPAMSIQDVVNRRNIVVEFVSKAMNKDVDFGVIPGATKNTLLKPGAEKLCTLFGLSTRFLILESVEDWTGTEHGGEPFFHYLYHCTLSRGDYLIGEGDGLCNSRESKYRYRNASRLCPSCGKETIIKGKEEYGGGWLCFAKKGGCGEKFGDTDERIIGQNVGKVVNPDVADQANTILKMAQKRALIAATLIAVNASEFFTQDLEDMAIEGEFKVVEQGKPEQKLSPPEQPQPKRTLQLLSTNQRTKLIELYKEVNNLEDEGVILAGLDAAFQSLCKKNLASATYEEASKLISQLISQNKAAKA